MAISAPHYQLLKSIKHLLPVGGLLLEIGEANWYGDVDPLCILEELNREWNPSIKETSDAVDAINSVNLFAIAKAFYASLFAPSKIVSIDINGTPAALRHDLNAPLPSRHDTSNSQCPGNNLAPRDGIVGFLCTCPSTPLDEQFDLVINHGTSEHVFNIAQVFATMHDCCTDGGLMIHESPFTGWIDHGFYCLQPTLFYDLAAANCYEVVLVALETINPPQVIRLESRDHVAALATAGALPNNAMLFVVFRKRGEMPFKIPAQGYYSRKLSPAGQQAWSKLR